MRTPSKSASLQVKDVTVYPGPTILVANGFTGCVAVGNRIARAGSPPWDRRLIRPGSRESDKTPSS